MYSIMDDQLLSEIDIGNISTSSLKAFINARDGDPDFHKIYKLSISQFINLVRLVPSLSGVSYDNKVEIYLESYQMQFSKNKLPLQLK